MLPNSGIDLPSLPDETKTIQVSACDEPVPFGTVVPSSQTAKPTNSSQSENSVASGNKIHRLIVVPKSQMPGDNGILQQLESEPVCDNTAENNKTLENAAAAETHGLPRLNSLNQVLLRQKKLNSNASCLLKRLRRLQCREVNSAIKEKLRLLVSSLSQAAGEKTAAALTVKPMVKDTLGNRELTSLSTAELVSYVQKMQSSQQHSFTQRQSVGLDSLPSGADDGLSILNDTMRSNMRNVSGQLFSNLRHLKSGLDSDATESSSGGESGDELTTVSKDASTATAAATLT
jgi:hypothetical protein